MKKDRNSFFGSTNFNMSAMGNNLDGMMPNPGMPNMNASMPNVTMPNPGVPSINAASSNFYAAQNMPMPLPNYPQGNPNTASNSTSELESRMAKLERSINRLEARLNKLEGSTFYSKETYETDGNMYMV